MRLKNGLIAAAAVLSACLNASPILGASPENYPFADKAGQHGWIDAVLGGWWICPTQDDLAKIHELAFQNDSAAEMKVYERNCIHVQDGTEVVVEKTAWFSTKICVRPVGEPNCGWIEPGFVTKVQCTRENWRQHQGCSPHR